MKLLPDKLDDWILVPVPLLNPLVKLYSIPYDVIFEHPWINTPFIVTLVEEILLAEPELIVAFASIEMVIVVVIAHCPLSG